MGGALTPKWDQTGVDPRPYVHQKSNAPRPDFAESSFFALEWARAWGGRDPACHPPKSENQQTTVRKCVNGQGTMFNGQGAKFTEGTILNWRRHCVELQPPAKNEQNQSNMPKTEVWQRQHEPRSLSPSVPRSLGPSVPRSLGPWPALPFPLAMAIASNVDSKGVARWFKIQIYTLPFLVYIYIYIWSETWFNIAKAPDTPALEPKFASLALPPPLENSTQGLAVLRRVHLAQEDVLHVAQRLQLLEDWKGEKAKGAERAQTCSRRAGRGEGPNYGPKHKFPFRGNRWPW